MPLLRLIILIANAHPYLTLQTPLRLPERSRFHFHANAEWPGPLQGSEPFKKPELPFTALAMSDVIDVFGPRLSDERAGAHQAWVLKTSFSRFVR